MTPARLFLVACSLVLLPSIALSEEEAERKVSVSGTAVTTVVPDLVDWRLTVKSRDEDLATAKAESDEKIVAILALREPLGIAPEDLQTGHLSIRRDYKRDQQGNEVEFRGFVVTREVTIRQRDLKRFDEYLTKLVAAADVEVGFAFDTSRRHEIRNDTRLKACLAAKAKAEAMVEVLGASLGKVLVLEEERDQPSWRTYLSNVSGADDRGPAVADVTSETLAPGSIEIRITVNAAFAIE